MKIYVIILMFIAIFGSQRNLNAQSILHQSSNPSVVAVMVMDMWVEGRITKDLGDRIVLRIRPEEASRLNTNELLSVYKSSIDMVRVRVQSGGITEELSFDSRVKSSNKRKRLTATGIGLLVSGILSVVIAQGELDLDQYKTLQTILGASLGVAGVAALTLGELESVEYPQLELALLLYNQSLE